MGGPVKGSLLEQLYRRGGIMKGSRVGSYIVLWAVASRDLGHEPTMEEFIAWSREPRRTVFRWQAEFRAVFPEWSTPQPFAASVAAELDRRGRGRDDPAAIVALTDVAVPS